jgi:ABC-type multidrug transport system ATPase subunit
MRMCFAHPAGLPRTRMLLAALHALPLPSLYASLKRIPNAEYVVTTQVSRFGLGSRQYTVAQSLTSTDKRRLTVALTTLGAPPVIILDSPTQGGWWDVYVNCK